MTSFADICLKMNWLLLQRGPRVCLASLASHNNREPPCEKPILTTWTLLRATACPDQGAVDDVVGGYFGDRVPVRLNPARKVFKTANHKQLSMLSINL